MTSQPRSKQMDPPSEWSIEALVRYLHAVGYLPSYRPKDVTITITAVYGGENGTVITEGPDAKGKS